MSIADDMTVLAGKLQVQMARLPTAEARPLALEALGWQLTRMGKQLLDEASKREGSPRVSRAEFEADRLSMDATRNPDLTYGDVS